MVLPSSCNKDKFTIWVARSTHQEELTDSKLISRYSFIKMKVDYAEVMKMTAGKQKPTDFHENCTLILQCRYFLLKDAEGKPKTKLHADSSANNFISCSSARTTLSVDGAQNIQPVLWRNLVKDKQLRTEEQPTLLRAPASKLLGLRNDRHTWTKAQPKPAIKQRLEG